MTHLKWLGTAFLILSISACGFQLKGMRDSEPLPFQTLHVDNSTSLAKSLNRVLKRNKKITISGTAEDADAVLKVSEERTQKDILVINRGGSVNEYLLVLDVKAQLFKSGVSYAEPMNISVRRNYTYSDNQVLGKEEEETLLWDDMRNEAAEQILRRLSYLRPNLDNLPIE